MSSLRKTMFWNPSIAHAEGSRWPSAEKALPAHIQREPGATHGGELANSRPTTLGRGSLHGYHINFSYCLTIIETLAAKNQTNMTAWPIKGAYPEAV